MSTKIKDLDQLVIETPRLHIEAATMDFAEDIFKSFQPPVTDLMRPKPAKNLVFVKNYISECLSEMKAGRRLFVVVLTKEDRSFLGCFGLDELDTRHPRIGGWLKEEAHGQGYGTEAAKAIDDWCLENIDYEYIIWPSAVENVPSAKIAESLGAKVEREYVMQTEEGDNFDAVEYWLWK